VDIDEVGHVVFGGSAPYIGWTIGRPQVVRGPTIANNAFALDEGDAFLLGDTGIKLGNWTLDLYVEIDASAAVGHSHAVLLSTQHNALVGAGSSSKRHALMLGAESRDRQQWSDSTVNLASLPDGWHRLTITSNAEEHSYYVDASLAGTLAPRLSASTPSHVVSIGARADGSSSFTLKLHRIRIFDKVLTPDEIDASGLLGMGETLAFHGQNTRWLHLSRGTDALSVDWSTIGSGADTEKDVSVTLDAHGDITVGCTNVSSLWDQALISAAGITDRRSTENLTSATVSHTASIEARFRYVQSDPCFVSAAWSQFYCLLHSTHSIAPSIRLNVLSFCVNRICGTESLAHCP
jgi:hypothetical protein